MRSSRNFGMAWAALVALTVAPATALAEPMSPSGSDSGASEPNVVGYEDSGNNADYVSKSDSEGATWTFDPQKVELTAGTSDTGTNFQGARILKGDEDVLVQGDILAGKYEDTESDRYLNWQGSTLYFGVGNPETGNSVDAIVEFFWFESSIPRGSDFYVMQVKVKSSPNPWDKWFLAKEPNFVDDYIFFWNDVQPSQHLDVHMEQGGAHGSLRWDFCVPFETYKWEPVKTMQISESYGAGYSLQGTGNVSGKASQQFKEGGMVADVTANANIQAKGYVNNDFKVQSQYTITLYRWQMLVQSGGQDIHYKLVVLPHDTENEMDSGYYEYFIVIQASRGTPVHIDEIEIGGMFRHQIPLWIDGYEGISATISDIWITPPRGVCLPGDIAPPGTCSQQGVCGLAEPECLDNNWVCPVMSVYEQVELSCDGLDNDCDGVVDEELYRECGTLCGDGYETCMDGKFQGCDAIVPELEICNDGLDNDCDGVLDNGCEAPPANTEDPNGSENNPDGTENNTNSKDSASNGTTDYPYTDPTSNANAYTSSGNTPKTPVPGSQGGCTQVQGSQATAGWLVMTLTLLSLVALRRREVRVCAEPRA